MINQKISQSFFLLFTILHSHKALSYPEIGNRKVLSVAIDTYDSEDTVHRERFKETLELIDYDSIQDRYKVSYKVSYEQDAPNAQTEEFWVTTQSFEAHRRNAQDMLANCESSYGGYKDWINVDTRTYETCVLPANTPEEEGNIWLGAVLFGIVKEHYSTYTPYGLQVVKRELIYLND